MHLASPARASASRGCPCFLQYPQRAIVPGSTTGNPRRYIETFQSGFDEGLKQVPVYFMQSDGGLAGVAEFSGHKAILSGPAGACGRLAGCQRSWAARASALGLHAPGRCKCCWPYFGLRQAFCVLPAVPALFAAQLSAAGRMLQQEPQLARQQLITRQAYTAQTPLLRLAGGYVGYATTTRWGTREGASHAPPQVIPIPTMHSC